MTRTQQRNALAIQMAFPLRDEQQTGCSSSFCTSRRHNLFCSPLVNLDHVTYTCPTRLMGLPAQSWTHCLYSMDTCNCCPRKQKTTLDTTHCQSSHLTQVDVTLRVRAVLHAASFFFPPRDDFFFFRWCLMSSDVSWHIRDKLRPMHEHGLGLLYILGNHKTR